MSQPYVTALRLQHRIKRTQIIETSFYRTGHSQNITLSTPWGHSRNKRNGFDMSNITALQSVMVFDETFPSWSTYATTDPKAEFVLFKDSSVPRSQILDYNPCSTHIRRLTIAMKNTVRNAEDSVPNSVGFASPYFSQLLMDDLPGYYFYSWPEFADRDDCKEPKGSCIKKIRS